MAKKKKNIPQYGTVTRKGVLYYRTRILDADGKQVSLYGTTCEELYDKEQEARRQVAEIIFHREHPTVAEYCEKWLLMQSAKVSPATLKGYASNMKNYIIKPLPFFFLPIPSPPKNNVQRCTFVLSDILGSSKDTEQLKLGHFAACGM